MRARLLIVLALTAFLGGVVLLNLSGAADVPDVITLKSTLWEEHTKSPVTFTHEKHSKEYDIACTECHHVYKDGKNVWQEGDPVQKCQECHDEPTVVGERRLSEEEQQRNLKLAFHENCLGCHRKLKMKDRQRDIPTTCTDCHPREEK